MVKPRVFTYLSPVKTNDPDNETLLLEVENIESGEKTNITDIQAQPDGSYEVPIDLSKANTGRFSFESTSSISNTVASEQLVINDDLYKDQFFGIVELVFNSSTLPAYELKLERKLNLWNYILVNRSNRTDFNSLLVKDNSTINAAPYQTYLFEKINPAFTIGNKPAVKFQSKSTIPWFELHKKDNELV